MDDNTGANTSAIAASCQASGADMWYTYTTGCDGEVYIDTCQDYLGSLEDTVLSVHDACGGAELACGDDAGNQRAKLRLAVTAGQTYLIRIAGYDAQSGQYTLRIGEPAPSALGFQGAVTNGWNGAEGLDGTIDLALSPDGRHLYASGVASLAAFERDPATGEPLFLEAKSIKEKALGNLHPSYATTLVNLAS